MRTDWEDLKKKYWPPRKDQLLILVLTGLLLAVIAIPTERGKDSADGKEDVQALPEAKEADYGEQLEQRLEELLGSVEGVGKVRVMLTFEDGGEKQVEKDVQSADTEQREETVYEEKGSERTPYVTAETTPKVKGVLVIAEGGGDSRIRQEILEAAQALFGAEPHKIKIMKMEGTQ